MKTNHGSVINRRMRDNYGDILLDMTPEETIWAEKFERLEYAIERGFALEATSIAKELNPSVAPEVIARIRADVETKDRCNPVKAEYDARRFAEGRISDREPPSNMYDAYDWHRDAGTILDDDGNETERGITISPEDALIAALDAAKTHGISLTTFMTNPLFWTPERKAGRPKKLSEV